MPILKHAKKKLKQDKKRTIKNKKIKDTYKKLVKNAKEKSSPDTLSKAFSAVDKAAKKNIMSQNKAARLKSSLSKISSGKAPAVSTVKPKAKAAPKKTAAKSSKASKSSGAKKKPTSKK